VDTELTKKSLETQKIILKTLSHHSWCVKVKFPRPLYSICLRRGRMIEVIVEDLHEMRMRMRGESESGMDPRGYGKKRHNGHERRKKEGESRRDQCTR
jgi:hypothetical protein